MHMRERLNVALSKICLRTKLQVSGFLPTAAYFWEKWASDSFDFMGICIVCLFLDCSQCCLCLITMMKVYVSVSVCEFISVCLCFDIDELFRPALSRPVSLLLWFFWLSVVTSVSGSGSVSVSVSLRSSCLSLSIYVCLFEFLSNQGV